MKTKLELADDISPMLSILDLVLNYIDKLIENSQGTVILENEELLTLSSAIFSGVSGIRKALD